MAVEPVNRLTIVAPKSLTNDVTVALQRAGTVHVKSVTPCEDIALREPAEEEVEAERSFTLNISKVDFLLDLFKQYSESQTGFVRTLIKDKFPMSVDEFLQAGELADLDGMYKECSEIETSLIELREKENEALNEIEELRLWEALDVSLDEIRGGDYFYVITVRLWASDADDFRSVLEKKAPESQIELVAESGEWLLGLILYHRTAEEAVSGVMSQYKCERVNLPGSGGPPGERLRQLEEELQRVHLERAELAKGILGFEEHVASLQIMREYYRNQNLKLQTMKSFGETEATFAIEGWVTGEGLKKTIVEMGEVSDEISVEVSEPLEGDNPPVSLRNNRFVKPFEFLTKLYGVPNNREYDPTWLIAVSFMVFFGFCIGDVGYGIVIIAAFLLMRKYLPLGRNTKDLLLVMVYGGFFAILFGVLTGSYFGYDPEKLPQFLKSLAVFDALKDPIPIMGVCMGLGVVHMLAGTVVELVDNIKQRNVADALIDQGLILLLFMGTITTAFLAIVGFVPVTAVFIAAGISLAGMVVLMGHSAKSVPGKVFGGLYETYNTLVGWLGDTVSYVRLFALGLATFAVGWVINILGGMVMGIAPVIGILLMLVVILVGHTFNVAVNLLGAFVHPLRLEYVEFFSKFYEDGGLEFSPLRVESGTVIISE